MTDQEFFTGSFGGGNPYYNAPTTTSTTPAPASNIFGLSQEQQGFLFGDANGAGALTQVAGVGNALAQSWLGFQQYGLAQDMFSFQKDAFNKNYAMQKDAYDTAKTNQTNTAAKQNA